jgi:hypothetical protein
MNYIILAVLFYISMGCVSMSSIQTARTLPAETSQQSVGGGVYNSEMTIGDNTVTTNLPYIEYSYRRGLTENWDAGLKLTFIGAYAADTKYQIFANDQWAFSAGAGLGYMSYKISSGGSDEEVKFIDIMLPFYLSYDISKSWAVYLSPKYISRQQSGASSGSDGITGLTIGTKIGEKSGVYAETSLIKSSSGDMLTQYNLSYFW